MWQLCALHGGGQLVAEGATLQPHSTGRPGMAFICSEGRLVLITTKASEEKGISLC